MTDLLKPESGPPLKALIFDLDGTLYCQKPVRRSMFLRLLARSLRQPRETLVAFRALQAYRQAQESLRHSGTICTDLAGEQLSVACTRVRVSRSAMEAYVATWMDQSPLDLLPAAMFDGVIDLLQFARNTGLRLGVWSDYAAIGKLKAMKIDDFFDTIVTAQDADVQQFKPSPRGLEVALSRLGVSKNEALYIGDRPDVDGAAAVRAGVRCLIVGHRTTGMDRCSTLSSYNDLTRFLSESRQSEPHTFIRAVQT